MWKVDGVELESRLFLGTALYPSPQSMVESIIASGAQVVTVSLRRQSPDGSGGSDFWNIIKSLNVRVLPNTAGCRTAKEAVKTARMAREVFNTNWIKLEVIGDDYNLQPDPFELIMAAEELLRDGFMVFPYTTSDLIVATKLVSLGCKIVMPWASPIGTGRGISDELQLKTLRARLPETTLIVDAGIGLPSHAVTVMELGFDAVLLNSAVALAKDPPQMADAFKLALQSGRTGFLAGAMGKRETASPSTPVLGVPFWHSSVV